MEPSAPKRATGTTRALVDIQAPSPQGAGGEGWGHRWEARAEPPPASQGGKFTSSCPGGGGGKAPPQKHVKHNHQKAKGYKCLYFSPHSMAVEFPQARGRRQLAHHFPQHDLCPICVLITTWVAGINAGSGTTRNL